MADIYSSEESLLRDYRKLTPEYRNKAGRYIKNLLRLQRAEQGIEKELHILSAPIVSDHTEDIRCSFCGKPQEEAFRLIAASHQDGMVYICDACSRLCNEILDEEEKPGDDPSDQSP